MHSWHSIVRALETNAVQEWRQRALKLRETPASLALGSDILRITVALVSSFKMLESQGCDFPQGVCMCVCVCVSVCVYVSVCLCVCVQRSSPCVFSHPCLQTPTHVHTPLALCHAHTHTHTHTLSLSLDLSLSLSRPLFVLLLQNGLTLCSTHTATHTRSRRETAEKRAAAITRTTAALVPTTESNSRRANRARVCKP